MPRERYTFGDFTLDAGDRRLTRAGGDLPLAPKAFDILVHLVRRAGRLVRKEELLAAVWPDTFVEEGILAVHVSGLRKALGDDPQSASCIRTVAKQGYRFVAAVERSSAAPDAHLPAPEVCEHVGRARGHLLSASRPGVSQAITEFQAALDLDVGYAPAHAGLALAYCAQAEFRLAPPREAFARAKDEALRALARDETSADALVALGSVMFFSEWDWMGAERSLQRALALNPDHTQARLLYGRLLDAQGKLAEGLDMKLLALERDPLSPAVHLAIALSYWNRRRYEESIRWATKTLDLDVGHLLAREFLAGAYWKLGDFDRYMAQGLEHAEHSGVTAEALEPFRRAYAAGGHQGLIRLVLAQAEAQPHAMPDMQLALFHGELGDLDAAMRYLDRAVDGRDPCLVDLAVAPQWDVLRADPRFARQLSRMGLPVLSAIGA